MLGRGRTCPNSAAPRLATLPGPLPCGHFRTPWHLGDLLYLAWLAQSEPLPSGPTSCLPWQSLRHRHRQPSWGPGGRGRGRAPPGKTAGGPAGCLPSKRKGTAFCFGLDPALTCCVTWGRSSSFCGPQSVPVNDVHKWHFSVPSREGTAPQRPCSGREGSFTPFSHHSSGQLPEASALLKFSMVPLRGSVLTPGSALRCSLGRLCSRALHLRLLLWFRPLLLLP